MTIKRILGIFLIFVFFVFLFIIRVHDYARYPVAGHADELNYGWSGLSLLQTGKPTGWSGYKTYPESWIVYDGLIKGGSGSQVGVKMISPWLDEPPLFSILAGLTSFRNNAKLLSILPPGEIRLPSIFFGAATTLLIYLLSQKLFDKKTAILASSLYTLTPLILFGSRYALPENGIAFFLVLALYLYVLFEDKKILFLLIAISAGIAGLMKPTGFFIAPLFSFFLIQKRNWKQAVLTILCVIPFVAGYLWYGNALGGSTFWEILRIQGFRPSGWTGLGFTLSLPSFSTGSFFDGWYIFLILSSFAIVLYRKKSAKLLLITTTFVYWLIVIVLSAGEQDLLAWYRYPLFPLISILGAIALIDMITRPTLLKGLIAIGMFFSSRFYLHNAFMATTSSTSFKLIFVVLAIPFIIGALHKDSKVLLFIQRGFLIGFILFGLFLNTKYIYTAYQVNCDNLTCPLEKETSLSQTRLPILWRLLVPTRFYRSN